jgi:hypothetical protein
MSSLSFHNFLRLECLAIAALVDEVDEHEMFGEDEVNMKIMDQLSSDPKLQDYFDNQVDEPIIHVNTNILQIRFSSKSMRAIIIDHLITMDIDVSLLIDVIESYRFDLEMEELVEIVRAFDILGAQRRLSEYEAVLYMKWKELESGEREWERICGDKLPVSFFDHIKRFENISFLSGSSTCLSKLIGIVGSQRLIEYFLGSISHSNKNKIFINLCEHGHITVAQWLHTVGEIDIHDNNDEAFQLACLNGHLLVAQWLYDQGGVDINADGNYPIRVACSNGHLFVVQWLCTLREIDIHGENDGVFRYSCYNGHLLVAQCLYIQGVDIHAEDDDAFRSACRNGHLSVAQWLYNLGGIDIHGDDNQGFRGACKYGRLSVAQWLYSLGGLPTKVLQTCLNSTRDHSVQAWLQSILTR